VDEDGKVKQVTVMLFGDATQCKVARELIEEAIDNREQKQKQRQKEYEKKKDAKARERQLYHLRHTRDYETLGVPIGTSKQDCKKAYRNLAKLWHPDKHPENMEEAKLKFQEIQRAYDSLMTTDEEQRIEAIGK
jgi:DnaJ-domain-containing protein 1